MFGKLTFILMIWRHKLVDCAEGYFPFNSYRMSFNRQMYLCRILSYFSKFCFMHFKKSDKNFFPFSTCLSETLMNRSFKKISAFWTVNKFLLFSKIFHKTSKPIMLSNFTTRKYKNFGFSLSPYLMMLSSSSLIYIINILKI